jgi:deoxyribonuclease-4
VRRLGVHTSIAGGVHLSLERARELGCSTMQIFSHNPRQWHVGRISDKEVRQFRERRGLIDIEPLFIHTSYLINLAAIRPDILDKSVQLLVREMELADALGAEYVVLHTGSASKDSGDNARRRASDAMRIVSGYRKWNARLLLENTAGERGDISSRIIDVAEIMNAVGSALVAGICLDTCHAFQAGYNLSREEGLDKIVKEIERHMGLERVKLIHLNDSKRAFNAGVDRHEHIGTGEIGKEGLERIIRHPSLKDIPLILETPKNSEEDDLRNLNVVRGFLIDLL